MTSSPTMVTGGTGTLGRLVVRRLRDVGRNVRVLSRRSHDSEDGIEFMTGDLATGEGIEAAVDRVESIVHCAGSTKGDEDKPLNLVRAASRGVPGAPHLVYISVVGADRIPVVSGVDRAMFGYFASKQAAEKVVEDSGLPWTTLRSASSTSEAPSISRARKLRSRVLQFRMDVRASIQPGVRTGATSTSGSSPTVAVKQSLGMLSVRNLGHPQHPVMCSRQIFTSGANLSEDTQAYSEMGSERTCACCGVMPPGSNSRRKPPGVSGCGPSVPPPSSGTPTSIPPY